MAGWKTYQLGLVTCWICCVALLLITWSIVELIQSRSIPDGKAMKLEHFNQNPNNNEVPRVIPKAKVNDVPRPSPVKQLPKVDVFFGT